MIFWVVNLQGINYVTRMKRLQLVKIYVFPKISVIMTVKTVLTTTSVKTTVANVKVTNVNKLVLAVRMVVFVTQALSSNVKVTVVLGHSQNQFARDVKTTAATITSASIPSSLSWVQDHTV